MGNNFLCRLRYPGGCGGQNNGTLQLSTYKSVESVKVAQGNFVDMFKGTDLEMGK